MKVWVVTWGNWDGGGVLAVFSTEEKARNYIKGKHNDVDDDDVNDEPEEMEIDAKV